MLKVLMARLKQGHRTLDYPRCQPEMPARYRGMPHIDKSKCGDSCTKCGGVCPTGALQANHTIDLGRCLFCGECAATCPAGSISHTRDFRMSSRTHEGLIIGPRPDPGTPGSKDVKDLKDFKDGEGSGDRTTLLAEALDQQTRRLFGRSLKLRQVSAGGCNACEADTNVLNTPVFDLGRFGIQFVASPRHADGLLITGPVSQNMKLALEKTYEAVPDPKIVIAVGACAISGGPYAGHPETCGGADQVVPVDLFIPGCPPNPWTILDGLLRLLGRQLSR